MSPRPASGAPRPLSPLRAVALLVTLSMPAPHAQSLQGTIARNSETAPPRPRPSRTPTKCSCSSADRPSSRWGSPSPACRSPRPNIADAMVTSPHAAAAARQGPRHDLDVRVGQGRRHHTLRSPRAARSHRAVGAPGTAVSRRNDRGLEQRQGRGALRQRLGQVRDGEGRGSGGRLCREEGRRRQPAASSRTAWRRGRCCCACDSPK